MSQFIIEMGSGNTCKNDVGKVREMIDAVVSVDSGKHEVIFKHQLFKDEPPNKPLAREVFAWAYAYARGLGYQTTASVFDIESLSFLDLFDVPFIKIACRPKLYYLADLTENRCVASFYEQGVASVEEEAGWLACVPWYPAEIRDYEDKHSPLALGEGISDHTVGWKLYKRYNPARIEKHFCLKHDKKNPDAGPFAVTPDELAEVL